MQMFCKQILMITKKKEKKKWYQEEVHEKTISILTESTIPGKIPNIFGQIDKAYKVHVKGLTFCSLIFKKKLKAV